MQLDAVEQERQPELLARLAASSVLVEETRGTGLQHCVEQRGVQTEGGGLARPARGRWRRVQLARQEGHLGEHLLAAPPDRPQCSEGCTVFEAVLGELVIEVVHVHGLRVCGRPGLLCERGGALGGVGVGVGVLVGG